MPNTLDIPAIRAQFPALSAVTVSGRPAIFLDAPGGTQVPRAVIEAMTGYLTYTNANHEGAFLTSQQSDAMLVEAHIAAADFFNAASPQQVVFGANMTTLTLHISRSIAREIGPGDEIIVTRLDHDANIWPWVLMAEDRGATVRWVDFDVEECTLDMAMLRDFLSERTKLVAVGYASNAAGTINNIPAITAWAHDVGAMVYVDAVHYGPHGPIDVQALDCDFLVCSAYKFFGPHLGVLYGRYGLLESLPAYKARPANDAPPHKFETGTQSFEALAGVKAAVDYLASVGRRFGSEFASEFPGFEGRRRDLKVAMSAIRTYERGLCQRLVAGLGAIPGLRIYGITDPARFDRRAPTVSFTVDGLTPREIARRLDQANIFVWDGNFYALAVTKRLGLEGRGGLLRVGLAHYNTAEEVETLLGVLADMPR
jgi:cysteine desulfurase family protein (TIGR01976 family)